MTASFGIGMFFFGVTVTVIGFFIAYIVASKHHKAQEEAKKEKEGPLTFL